MAKRSPLETRLRVTFKNPALLQHALVHSSYVNENPNLVPESNERMEFLGDAVLGLVVADALYAAFPGQDEGMLTELRAHLVRRDTLAEAARKLGLGEALLLGRGEDDGGGRQRPTNLSHIYEAIVGAIFLDRGLATARRFVLTSLRSEFEEIDAEGFPLDPKSRLQEISQSRYQDTPSYNVIDTQGPDHARRFTVEAVVQGETLGTGSGRSKQAAEKQAAKEALERLERRSASEKAGMSGACT